jgi:flavin-dependent dehydrogenase
VRATLGERERTVPWPEHPDTPAYGLALPRSLLDAALVACARAAGATVYEATEAAAPVVDRGFVRGAHVVHEGVSREVRAPYVVVADGANSRFGRALGTFRDRSWPYSTAIRGYYPSARSRERWLDVVLGLSDRSGDPLPGFGWVFPLGDGTVNVGVGLLSTFRDFTTVNTSHLLAAHLAAVRERFAIDVDQPLARPASGRIPLGGSVGPKAGPTYLVVGDAAGVASPFSGDGIQFALETGRLAADVLDEAITTGDSTALQQYPKRIEQAYGSYFGVGRLAAQAVGRPAVMRRLGRAAVRRSLVLDWTVRVGTNLLRADEIGTPETLYRLAGLAARWSPGAG